MRKKESTSRKRSNIDTALSARTKKQIDSLPEHAQHIFKKVHANTYDIIKIQLKDEEEKVKVLKKSLIKQHGLLLSRSTKSEVISGYGKNEQCL